MKKACGTSLMLYGACVVVIGVVLWRRSPDAIVWAFLAALPAWFGMMYVWEVARRFKTAAMIRRARSGDAPRDGKKIAAIGRIAPNGGALVAPFSKTACVIYDYKIMTGFSSDDMNLYIGAAQTPSTIQTPHGSIRLLAHPDVKLRDETVPREVALPNALEYIQSTQFRETGIGNITSSLKELLDAYKDDDGSVRYDNKLSGTRDTQPIETAFFVEKLVRPGDEVCVIGEYSAQRGGIVPDLKSPLINQTTLEPGSGDAPLRRARRGAIGYAIGACIFLGIVVVAFFAFMAINPLEGAEQQNPKLNATWPEIRLEWFVDSWVRPRMRQAGMLQRGAIANNLPAATAHGRVQAGGRDVSV
ncbi:MAG: YwiC-like family protein, partial [Acidobacteriota bacterium]|nr:YwiC-like family protein [Acidobacteriota bacterium]